MKKNKKKLCESPLAYEMNRLGVCTAEQYQILFDYWKEDIESREILINCNAANKYGLYSREDITIATAITAIGALDEPNYNDINETLMRIRKIK